MMKQLGISSFVVFLMSTFIFLGCPSSLHADYPSSSLSASSPEWSNWRLEKASASVSDQSSPFAILNPGQYQAQLVKRRSDGSLDSSWGQSGVAPASVRYARGVFHDDSNGILYVFYTTTMSGGPYSNYKVSRVIAATGENAGINGIGGPGSTGGSYSVWGLPGNFYDPNDTNPYIPHLNTAPLNYWEKAPGFSTNQTQPWMTTSAKMTKRGNRLYLASAFRGTVTNDPHGGATGDRCHLMVQEITLTQKEGYAATMEWINLGTYGFFRMNHAEACEVRSLQTVADRTVSLTGYDGVQEYETSFDLSQPGDDAYYRRPFLYKVAGLPSLRSKANPDTYYRTDYEPGTIVARYSDGNRDWSTNLGTGKQIRSITETEDGSQLIVVYTTPRSNQVGDHWNYAVLDTSDGLPIPGLGLIGQTSYDPSLWAVDSFSGFNSVVRWPYLYAAVPLRATVSGGPSWDSRNLVSVDIKVVDLRTNTLAVVGHFENQGALGDIPRKSTGFRVAGLSIAETSDIDEIAAVSFSAVIFRDNDIGLNKVVDVFGAVDFESITLLPFPPPPMENNASVYGMTPYVLQTGDETVLNSRYSNMTLSHSAPGEISIIASRRDREDNLEIRALKMPTGDSYAQLTTVQNFAAPPMFKSLEPYAANFDSDAGMTVIKMKLPAAMGFAPDMAWNEPQGNIMLIAHSNVPLN